MPTKTEQLHAKFARTAGRARGRETRLDREEIDHLLAQTEEADPAARCQAAQELCPCHVQHNEARVWDRLIALAQDPDVRVRRTVLHTLTDGSPHDREAEVVQALEAMYQDPDLKLRRHIRHLLASYRRHGNINLG